MFSCLEKVSLVKIGAVCLPLSSWHSLMFASVLLVSPSYVLNFSVALSTALIEHVFLFVVL